MLAWSEIVLSIGFFSPCKVDCNLSTNASRRSNDQRYLLICHVVYNNAVNMSQLMSSVEGLTIRDLCALKERQRSTSASLAELHHQRSLNQHLLDTRYRLYCFNSMLVCLLRAILRV